MCRGKILSVYGLHYLPVMKLLHLLFQNGITLFSEDFQSLFHRHLCCFPGSVIGCGHHYLGLFVVIALASVEYLGVIEMLVRSCPVSPQAVARLIFCLTASLSIAHSFAFCGLNVLFLFWTFHVIHFLVYDVIVDLLHSSIFDAVHFCVVIACCIIHSWVFGFIHSDSIIRLTQVDLCMCVHAHVTHTYGIVICGLAVLTFN